MSFFLQILQFWKFVCGYVEIAYLIYQIQYTILNNEIQYNFSKGSKNIVTNYFVGECRSGPLASGVVFYSNGSTASSGGLGLECPSKDMK